MQENELIVLLTLLAKAPSLVKKITENGFDTEFGLIETDSYGAEMKVTLFNGTVIVVDITGNNRSYIEDLFDNIKAEANEFALNILRENMKRCQEVLNNQK